MNQELAGLLGQAAAEVHHGLPVPEKKVAASFLDSSTAAAAVELAITTHCPQLALLTVSVCGVASRLFPMPCHVMPCPLCCQPGKGSSSDKGRVCGSGCDCVLRVFPYISVTRLISRLDTVTNAVHHSVQVRSGTVRDHDFTPEVYSGAYRLLLAGWSSRALVLRHRALYLFTKLMVMPEFDEHTPAATPSSVVLQTLFDQLGGGCPDGAEHPFLHQILYWVYARFPVLRAPLRALLGKCLRDFRLVGEERTAVAVVLDVLQHVIGGFGTPLSSVHRSLFHEVLLPLHQPNRRRGGAGGAGAVIPAGMPGSAMDGQPLLAAYHTQLVQCQLLFDDHHPGFVVEAVGYVLRHWPEAKAGVSSKEVLLLHELDTLLERAGPDGFAELGSVLVLRLVKCISGAFAQLAQRALQMWKKDLFAERVAAVPNALPQLVAACYRGGKPHWNSTVNRLSVTVLDDLHTRNPELFAAVCNARVKPAPHVATALIPTATQRQPQRNRPNATPAAHKTHPATGRSAPLAKRPIAAVGFVPTAAPWGKAKLSRWAGGKDQPPATTTGVAPWAHSGVARPPPVRVSTHPPSSSRRVVPVGAMTLPEDTEVIGEADEQSAGTASEMCILEEAETIPEEQNGVGTAEKSVASSSTANVDRHEEAMPAPTTGYACVVQFMDVHRGAIDDNAAVTDANAMKLTPTFLPELKFHELVFGHDLGSGAFSTVRLAKHVDRSKPGSQWSQYAVKLISISKIEEHGSVSLLHILSPFTPAAALCVTMPPHHHPFVSFLIDTSAQNHSFTGILARDRYEASVNREIAVLRVMSHPGIARMVAHFRWRDGAYLVLEYAAKGDLHSYIVANGSLDLPSSRFIAGEVLAALHYVHSAGFAFSDLKSENVVLMESGHAKITDFGGARPLTEAAQTLVAKGRLAVRLLRSGDEDWRIERDRQLAAEQGHSGQSGAVPSTSAEGTAERATADSCDVEPDTRAEGTAAFLAPEIARGGMPSIPGDCWAFGCLVYQMLAGRPPLWAETVADAMEAIVRFEADGAKFPDSFPEPARALVSTLLDPAPTSRSTLVMMASHAFFDGLDVDTLYDKQAPELAAGAVGPSPDAKWARRQNSMLWQPMPAAIPTAATIRTAVPGLAFERIPETAIENTAPFVTTIDSVAEP
jgi:serine/threonine protein kinase